MRIQRDTEAAVIDNDRLELALKECKSDEDLMVRLRAEGCSIVDTMRVLITRRGYSMDDAKRKAHFSEAWKSVRAQHEAFHESLFKAFDEIEKRTDGWNTLTGRDRAGDS